MSKEIKLLSSNFIIEGNNTYPRSGAFEITINGKLVYSKFETNSFPSKKEIKNMINDKVYIK